MLTLLHIKNFTLITELQLEVDAGLTILTGETGVGKSILFDALLLALGARPQTNFIRNGCDSSEISACFDISNHQTAQDWLTQHDFDPQEDCLLQRIIHANERSRCYINGRLVSRQQLHELGQLLVLIHGQHDQHTLLKREMQRALLDNYGKHAKLIHAVKTEYAAWQAIQNQLDILATRGDQSAQITLLQYQVDELDTLALSENEVTELEAEHKQLAHADTLLQDSQHVLQLCSEDPDVTLLNLLEQAQHRLQPLLAFDPRIQTVYDLLNQSHLHAQEAVHELTAYLQTIDLNPQRLHDVEQRLQTIYNLARKHHVKAHDLYAHQQTLLGQLSELRDKGMSVEQLQKQQQDIEKAYQAAAEKLTHARQKTAAELSHHLSEQIQRLGMPHAQFSVSLIPHENLTPRPFGQENVEFLFTSNPGQSLAPLAKIASGGELSRVSLAIQVLTAQEYALPTLIFDEIDTGIGGSTAAIVGQLLKQLGQHAQVLCVTHLPQVAAYANHHWQVSKHVKHNQTQSQVMILDKQMRVTELARMLGGLEITQQTLAHAQEMLASGETEQEVL